MTGVGFETNSGLDCNSIWLHYRKNPCRSSQFYEEKVGSFHHKQQLNSSPQSHQTSLTKTIILHKLLIHCCPIWVSFLCFCISHKFSISPELCTTITWSLKQTFGGSCIHAAWVFFILQILLFVNKVWWLWREPLFFFLAKK